MAKWWTTEFKVDGKGNEDREVTEIKGCSKSEGKNQIRLLEKKKWQERELS